MAARLVLHLPVAPLQHDSCSSRHRPREDGFQKRSRLAPSLDICTHREEKYSNGRGSSTVCHAKKERKDPFGGDSCIIFDEPHGFGPNASNMGIDDGLYGSTNRKQCNMVARYRNKKQWLDPFNWGDEPRLKEGLTFAEEGLQEPEPPTFPPKVDSPDGYLDFPAFFNVELASLPVLVRGDVRKCCCLVTGGVYENLLFFPVIQMLKERYPGVVIDIIATDRGKQTYELNKNVRHAWAFQVDSGMEPADYMEMVGNIKNEDYELLVSTKLTGLGHATTLWMTSARDKVSYIYPDVNAAGAGISLTDWAVAPRLNLAEGGYHMYTELIEVLKNPQPKVPEMTVRPLEIGISKRLAAYVEQRYTEEGLTKGKFLVFHGLESTSKASMQSQGDLDSLLPVEQWAEIGKAASLTWVLAVPMGYNKLSVIPVLGKEAKTMIVTTPGQLAALIKDSAGVVTTHTAAVQLACALRKPSVALFSSAGKASLFIPFAKERQCRVVASDTGKLVDVDLNAVVRELKSIEEATLVSAA